VVRRKLAWRWGRACHNAVRNRSKIIQGLVQHCVAGVDELKIASIACGPAREVAATMNLIAADAKNIKIKWTLLDQDKEALDDARKNFPDQTIIEPNFINAGVRDFLQDMEWYLIHRTGDDMMALAKAAAPEGRHFVMAEPEGINLILVSSKPL
jgi:hypothetical protein